MSEGIEQPGTRLVRVGEIRGFSGKCNSVRLDSRDFLLIKADNEVGARLFSAVCPHMGGQVAQSEGVLQCPIHGWTFDQSSGESLNPRGEKLDEVPLQIIDEVYFALLEEEATTRELIRREDASLTARLLSHATLRFSDGSFSLLTDPWLWGPAFLGAWMQYPKFPISPDDAQSDAIFITHEHSDHLHLPTLKKLDRNTPIYFPRFPNRRIEQRLTEEGFTAQIPMNFGEPYELASDVKITAYEPRGWWNDSIVLIEMGGIRVLNINDAGLNPRLAKEIGPVDVLASLFSPGASGYPWTWSHLTKDDKVAIDRASCRGSFNMLQRAVSLYGATHLIPFAGHFSLWHHTHLNFEECREQNTVQDVVDEFQEHPVRVIDLMPGESFDFLEGLHRKIWKDRRAIYDWDRKRRNIERWAPDESFESLRSTDPKLTRREVVDYFLSLNSVPEIKFCEPMRLSVSVTDDDYEETFIELNFTISDARITEGTLPNQEVVWMKIPERVLVEIVRRGESWDEAHIGYWCRFRRSPDQFHAGLWRLLHAPYFVRSNPLHLASADSVSSNSVIGEVLENLGEHAERVLGRYGLYCRACDKLTTETLAEAVEKHGLAEATLERMVNELDWAAKRMT